PVCDVDDSAGSLCLAGSAATPDRFRAWLPRGRPARLAEQMPPAWSATTAGASLPASVPLWISFSQPYRNVGSGWPAIGGIEADLQHAVFAANCFERALPRHFKLAFEPWRESAHNSFGVGRGVDESGRKAAPKRHSLDSIATLQHQRQHNHF